MAPLPSRCCLARLSADIYSLISWVALLLYYKREQMNTLYSCFSCLSAQLYKTKYMKCSLQTQLYGEFREMSNCSIHAAYHICKCWLFNKRYSLSNEIYVALLYVGSA